MNKFLDFIAMVSVVLLMLALVAIAAGIVVYSGMVFGGVKP